jgi:hypothetical protein
MAIRLQLGNYEPVQADPLGRRHIGYFPRMREDEAWEAGRGMWKINTDKAGRQRFALIVGEGHIRAIAEITDITTHGDRVALGGMPLSAGHPLYDAYIDQPDPVTNGSHNPIAYCQLPEEQPFLQEPCACDCGQLTDRPFLPSHDIRAIKARVHRHFGGSPLRLIQWIDATFTVQISEGDATAATQS